MRNDHPSENRTPFEPNGISKKRCGSEQKAHRQNGDGLCCIDSREFRGPVELFLASVAEWDAEWDGDVVRLVMAA